MELFTVSIQTIIGIVGGIFFIYLLNRLKKEVQQEKDRLAEGKSRKEGNKVLNKIEIVFPFYYRTKYNKL